MADLDQAEQDKKEQMQAQRQVSQQLARIQRRDKINKDQKTSDKYKGALNQAGRLSNYLGKDPKGRNFKKFEKALGKGVKKIKTDKAAQRGVAVWIIAILVALTKDMIDMGNLEINSGWDWVIDVLIGVFMFWAFGRSVKLARKLIVTALTTAAEAIPILGFGWWWTLSVLYLFWKAQGAGERD